MGAAFADSINNLRPDAGESHVFSGDDFSSAITHRGTASSDILHGDSSDNVLVGGRGNDVLHGNGGADVLRGGEGQDSLVIPDADFAGGRRILGGHGHDTLMLTGEGVHLNLVALPDNRIVDIETINIAGTGDNTLTLNVLEVLNISRHSNRLVVQRDAGDTINIGEGWTQQSDAVVNGMKYEVFEVPQVVTFPADESSVTCVIDAVDDLIVDGNQTVTISAISNERFAPQPDLSFGINGRVLTGLKRAEACAPWIFAVQADGQIVAVGEDPDDSDRTLVKRYNVDGSWSGTLERIAFGLPVTEGPNPVTFQIPAAAMAGKAFARFRICTTGRLPHGGAALDGEVEDYIVTLSSSVPGSNMFATAQTLGFVDSGMSLTAVDIDGDGDGDLLAGEHSGTRQLRWFARNPDGMFTPHDLADTQGLARHSSVADLDGDGDFDIVHAGQKLLLLENDGRLNFAALTLSFAQSWATAAADFDDDGDLDLLHVGNTVKLYRNSGGLVLTPETLNGLSATGLAVADFDGDGDPDFATVNTYSPGIAWYENDGTGNFSAHNLGAPITNFPSAVTSDDLDSDGDIDLLVASGIDDHIDWYMNDGQGVFTRIDLNLRFDAVTDLAVADVNGDGFRDLLVSGLELAVYYNQGDQTFDQTLLSTRYYPAAVVSDGDGDLDVAALDNAANELHWFENLNVDNGLVVAITAASISEAQGANATYGFVSRSSDTATDLVVNLSSSDVSEATVPATVTIPAGHRSATFTIDAVDDTVADTTQTVTISASAVSHSSGGDIIEVSDDEPTDAAALVRVSPLGSLISISENAGTLENAADEDGFLFFAHALAQNVPGGPVGTPSLELSYLFLVVDSSNDVIELDEANNSGRRPLIDSDHITYFPWDKNGDGIVAPLEALTSIQQIGTADVDSDFDGDGTVTPLEALSAIQRIGYVRAVRVAARAVLVTESDSNVEAGCFRTPVTAAPASLIDPKAVHVRQIVTPIKTAAALPLAFVLPVDERTPSLFDFEEET